MSSYHKHLDISSSLISIASLYMCESFISVLYTLDFCPTVKYPGHSMSNMAPLNFVQDIFTSQRFMAERIKVVVKVV